MSEGRTVNSPLLLTVNEAAKRLSIGRTSVYGLIREGTIASVTIGKSRRVPAEELTRYVNNLLDS